jgi:hypothetical protein
MSGGNAQNVSKIGMVIASVISITQTYLMKPLSSRRGT